MITGPIMAGRILVAPTTAYVTGDRTGSITPTTSFATVTYTNALTKLLDGSFTASSAGSLAMAAGSLSWADGDYWQFQWATKQFIDEMKFYSDRALTNPWGNWKSQYWDGSAFHDLNSFTWNTTTQIASVTGMPPEGTTILRVAKVGATSPSTSIFFEEVEFKSAPGAT